LATLIIITARGEAIFNSSVLHSSSTPCHMPREDNKTFNENNASKVFLLIVESTT